MTPDRYRLLLEQSDAKVRATAEQAFQALLIRIRNGEKPRPAIAAVMAQFNAGMVEGLAETFSALLATIIGVADMRDWPVGKVKLSDVLYTNAQAVSATTRTIIDQHMKGPHAARELAKALYEGYDFKVDPLDVAGQRETLPKYLRLEFDKARAAQLKTPALRAAYLQAIAAQERGQGTDALQRVLQTAFYERNRYYANRIARTELHRAYTDQQSRELMKQDRIEYVQLRLSSKHPKTDICDYHAKVNLYGLGPGVYPKADAPKPPFHPHCFCVVSPKIDLPPKLKPRFNPDAERKFLEALPFNESRQVAGSAEKRDRILAGKATIEEVYNEGKDELYKWKRVGDILSPATATQAGAAVSNAYEVAKAGGRHHGAYIRYLNQRAPEIEKSIRSFTKRIQEHQDKIDHPMDYVQSDITEQHLAHLVSTLWPEEIMDFEMKIEIMKGILRERNNG